MRLPRQAAALVLGLTVLVQSAAAVSTAGPELLVPVNMEERVIPEKPVIYGYQEGYAQAQSPSTGKWGFANANGDVVIPIQYDSVVSFSLGMAAVEVGGKLGVIRPDGRYLIRPEYDSLLPLNCGLYIAQRGNNWGVASVVPFRDKNGQWTNEAVALNYQKVEMGTSGGLDALILTPYEGSRVIIPAFQLPDEVERLGIEGSRFPLTLGKRAAFSDVSQRDWFSLWVNVACNTGLMDGRSGSVFAPMDKVKVSEAIQIAANMDSRFLDDDFHLGSGASQPWYGPAVNYCLAHNIITQGQFSDYERPVTRRELARIFAATALANSLTNRNDPAAVRGAVSDVSANDPAAPAIWSLYAKGIFNGRDNHLAFHPDEAVSRAEAAALAVRLARPEQRLELF